MAMPLIVFYFGLSGFRCRKGFLRGCDARYPLFTVEFLFFKAVILGRDAGRLHIDAMFGLANDSKWLLENYPSIRSHLKLQRDSAWRQANESTSAEVWRLRDGISRANDRASKAESENRALREAIKICSE